MEDGLAGARSGIDHRAIAAFRQATLVGYACRDAQKMSKRRFVALRSFVQRFDVLVRNHKNMHRRLRVDIIKGECAIVAMNDTCRNGAVDNLTKDTIGF